MNFQESLSLGELNRMFHVVDASLSINSHRQLFDWLQANVQLLLPHDIVIAAWGDFSLGIVSYDLVSPLPGLRTVELDDGVLHPFVTDLFERWKNGNHAPYALVSSHGFGSHNRSFNELIDTLRAMPSALVHGIKDQRGRHDCLYIFLGPESLGGQRSCEILRYLLPYIDTAFRQVAHLPAQYLPASGGALSSQPYEVATLLPEPADDEPADEFGLSAREHSIMEWVRAGKTSHEIGLILDISTFTVKNHLQRIFRKLNVVNRAQAVSKMSGMKVGNRQ